MYLECVYGFQSVCQSLAGLHAQRIATKMYLLDASRDRADFFEIWFYTLSCLKFDALSVYRE